MIQDAVSAEVGHLLNVISRARGKSAGWDLEALERATRAALQRDDARLLQELLEQPEPTGPPLRYSCGQEMRCEGARPKRLVSLLGTLVLQEDLARFCCRLWLRPEDCYGNSQVAVSVPNRPCNAEDSLFLNECEIAGYGAPALADTA